METAQIRLTREEVKFIELIRKLSPFSETSMKVIKHQGKLDMIEIEHEIEKIKL